MVVSRNGVDYGAPLEVSSSLGLFGNLDYLFVVQFLFSLFGLLLSFDAVTREKEAGTLRSILANPVSRTALAASFGTSKELKPWASARRLMVFEAKSSPARSFRSCALS